jgi:hypothetical protein
MTEAQFEPTILAFACQHDESAQVGAGTEALLVEEACVA